MQFSFAAVAAVLSSALLGSAAAHSVVESTSVDSATMSSAMELNPSGAWGWAAGSDTQCTKFVVPELGDYCDKVAMFAGISSRWFMEQNPQLEEGCGNLWANTKYCVAPPKGQPGRDSPVNVEDVDKNEAKNLETDNNESGTSTLENEAGVVLRNKSPDTVCFGFEIGGGVSKDNLPSSATCQGPDGFHGISVPAGQSKSHRFLPGYYGAINVVVNGVRGARQEITLVSGNPPGAFYDVDYEFGLSSSTFGPLDGSPRPDGGDSLMGEPDILAKANEQFKKLSTIDQQALVSASGEKFIKQGPSGDLIWVRFHFTSSSCFVVTTLTYIHRSTITRRAHTRCGISCSAWPRSTAMSCPAAWLLKRRCLVASMPKWLLPPTIRPRKFSASSSS